MCLKELLNLEFDTYDCLTIPTITFLELVQAKDNAKQV